jgi:hypothetical protein
MQKQITSVISIEKTFSCIGDGIDIVKTNNSLTIDNGGHQF